MRCQSPACRLSTWTFALALLGVGPAWGQQEPGAGEAPDAATAVPGSEPDALARYVPTGDLSFYVEFQGFEAHPDAWRKTAASQILSETKTGAMLGEIFTQIIDQGLPPLPGGKLSGADATALARHALNTGFVFAKYGLTEKPSTVLVIRDAFREDNRKALARFLGTTSIAGPDPQVTDKPGGRRVVSSKKNPAAGWWVEKDHDLVIASQVDAVIAAIDGQANAATSPDRQALTKADGDFQPIGLAFLKPPAGSSPPSAAALGLDGLKKVDYRWGFEGDTLRSELRIIAPSPRSGLLALLEQPTFSVDDLPPLPEGIEGFAVLSLDLDKTYGSLVDLATSLGGPESVVSDAFAQIEKAIQDRTHKDLRGDILSQLGPRVTYYTLPSETTDADADAGADADADSALASASLLASLQVPKFVVMVDVKDARKFSATVAELIGVLNDQFEEAVAPPEESDDPGPGAQPKRSSSKRSSQAAEFRMTSVSPPTWLLSLPTALSSLTNLRLTVTVGQEHLILAATPDAAREALAFEEQKDKKPGVPSGELAEAIKGLPGQLIFLLAHDASETITQNLTDLPATIPTRLQALALNPVARLLATTFIPPAEAKPSGPGAGGAGQPPPPGLPGAPPGKPPAGVEDSPLAMLAKAKVQIEIPDDKRLNPQAIAGYLFPGSVAIAAEDQGLRIITREAFPNVGSSLDASAILMLSQFLPGPDAKAPPGQGPGAPPGIPVPGGGPGGRPGGGGRRARPN